ncbi:MAG TPA: HDOD domain-containing protein, partial [Opitutales bacterium]|nr:HDOD domain-containing protein [Opitutales bacterium]
PVIEEISKLGGQTHSHEWRAIWQHSLGTAILTREILAIVDISYGNETDYLVGLLHNIGHLVIANTFPDVFVALREAHSNHTGEIYIYERELLAGWDHASIGAKFLQRHDVNEEIVNAAQFHTNPSQAGLYQTAAAAAQLADYLLRSTGTHGFETACISQPQDWYALEGWPILFGEDPEGYALVASSLQYSLERMPGLLADMI